MRRLILLVNLGILTMLIVLAQRIVLDWQEFERSHNIENMAKQALLQEPEVKAPVNEPPVTVIPFPDLLVVADRNLFSPERRPPAPAEEEAEAAAAPQPPPLPVKPSLSGVLSVRGEKQAFLTVFSGNKTQGQPRTVRLGDVVEGYQVSEITDSTVKLSWNDHHVLIDRDESARPQKERAAGRAAAAVNIIKVGTAVAAVETTTATEAADEEEKRGVEVGVVAASNNQAGRGGMQRGLNNTNRGLGGNGRGLRPQGGNLQNQNGAGFGTVGIPPGPNSPIDNR